MNNPGVYTLAALSIGAAAAQKILTPIENLGGMTAVSLEANFAYGSGAGTVVAIVVTTFDGGVTWRHVARFDFANAAAIKAANLSGLKSNGIAAYADLAVEGVNDGLLGDQLAVLVSSTGTYTNTTLGLRASVR
jgi:hypothetical protein